MFTFARTATWWRLCGRTNGPWPFFPQTLRPRWGRRRGRSLVARRRLPAQGLYLDTTRVWGGGGGFCWPACILLQRWPSLSALVAVHLLVAAPDLYGECIHPLEGVSEASTVPERLASLGLSFGCSSRLVQGQREQKTETNGSCGPGRCNRLQPPDPQGYPHARQEEGLCDVWGEAHEDCEGVWCPNRVWLHHLQCSSLQGDVFCRIPS